MNRRGRRLRELATLTASGNYIAIVANALIPNLLCSRTAGSSRVYAIELTALQLSDPRVTPWSRC